MDVTYRMIDAASSVISEKVALPYMARARDFTTSQIQRGDLRRADDEAERQNREWIAKIITAALAATEE